MRRYFALMVAAAVTGFCLASAPLVRAAGNVPASNVPAGIKAGQVRAVSCSAPGNCSAGGSFTDRRRHVQAFVVNEVGGAWGTPLEVPGSAALNVGHPALVDSLSCSAPGNCSAGGYYGDFRAQARAFVVSEVRGTWGRAEKMPGIAALSGDGGAVLFSLSCASAGNCGAGGTYFHPSAIRVQAFVASQTHGAWANATEVPGSGALNTGGVAKVQSVSCASPGACVAGGFYSDSSSDTHAFLVTQTDGIWGQITMVPGLPVLTPGQGSIVLSVSCATAGNCGAGGSYTGQSLAVQAFLVGEKNGTWGQAIEVPGTAALNAQGFAQVQSVSCPSPGNCGAAGTYTDRTGRRLPFVADEKNGTWDTAVRVPGIAVNAGLLAAITQISCPSPGNCGAGGYYTDRSGHVQAFVVNQIHGVWRTAVTVPGSAALNVGGQAAIEAISCPSAGNCSAGGYVSDGSRHNQPFVIDEKNGIWGTAQKVPGL
jgi:hypothetical protein